MSDFVRTGQGHGSTRVFADGIGNVPGCRCKSRCDFPCWQREGIAPPCPECGCPPDLFPPPDEPPDVANLDIEREARRV